ncbi:MAG: M3 family oligoendopeptidase, partial [Solirubrobacteraceae bacterium]
MATTADNLADPELLEAAWDLSALVDGDEDHGVTRQLDAARERASAFSERYAGRVADLDAAGLAEAMGELAELNELVGKAGS